MSILSYRELIQIPDYKDRFEYLRLNGQIGQETFGHDRHINQQLYNSMPWRRFRSKIILRDDGCDMAHPDYKIAGVIVLHHINPLLPDDIYECRDYVFDEDNVICVSRLTHEAIHYSDDSLLPKPFTERTMNDTIPWR